MKEEVIQNIISQLELNGLLKEGIPVTVEEFMGKLYINNDDRKEMLKAIMSLFSEDYRSDLQECPVLVNELALKIHELGFTTKENKFNFVLGKCTKDEQEVVYEKMFIDLNFLLIADEQYPDMCLSTPVTERFPFKDNQPAGNKLKKFSKKTFNLEQAKKNLEMAQKTFQDTFQFLEQRKLMSEQAAQLAPGNFLEKEIFDLSKLASTVEVFEQSMGSYASSTPERLEDRQTTAGSELGSAVEKLHSELQHVSNAIKLSSEDTATKKKYNLEEMLKRSNELQKNSILAKCFDKE